MSSSHASIGRGVNSYSVDYGFLCFFRLAEGIVFIRRKRIAGERNRPWKKISRLDVFMAHEINEGTEAEEAFPPKLLGNSLSDAYEQLGEERVKVAHAFFDEEDPVHGHAGIIADRLEGEDHAATRRAQARYIAHRLLKTEYWSSDESAEDQTP
jgi:hypothetical protein